MFSKYRFSKMSREKCVTSSNTHFSPVLLKYLFILRNIFGSCRIYDFLLGKYEDLWGKLYDFN